MKSNDDNENDDDDVWCNPEDEDNLEHCVKIDHERIEQIREILGNEILQRILETFEVKKTTIVFRFNFQLFICLFLEK